MNNSERLVDLAKRTGRVVLIKAGKIAGIVNSNFASGELAFNSFIYDRSLGYNICSSCEEEPRTKLMECD